MKTPPISAATSFSIGYRRWLLLLLMLGSCFAFIDRVIVQTLGQAIKEDLGLSDVQLGLLGGFSFAILYSTLGLPLARMAERRSRVNIISASIAIFSAMAAFCGLAQSFWQFIVYRIGVGIGEAGVQPPSVSLISDHFPPVKRASAVAIMQMGPPLGAVLGAMGGGWIALHYGWRAALAALAIPGLLLAVLMRVTLREPARGMSDPEKVSMSSAAEEPPSFAAVLRMLAAKKSFWHMLIGAGVAMLANYGWGAFTTPYLMRGFKLTIAQGGLVYGLVGGLGGAAGFAISGFTVDWIGKRDLRWFALLPAIALTLAVPCFLIAATGSNMWLVIAMIVCGNMLVLIHQPPTLAAFQNMVGPRMRATVAFMYYFMVSIVGVGFGPLITGFLSDRFATSAFTLGNFAASCPGGRAPSNAAVELAQACAAASSTGIRHALAAIIVTFAWAAIHYFFATRTVSEDMGIAKLDAQRT